MFQVQFGSLKWIKRSFGRFGVERVARGMKDKTKSKTQVITVNYGPTVIYGGPDLGLVPTVKQFQFTVTVLCPP